MRDSVVQFIELFMRYMREKLDQLAPATAQKNINLQVLSRVAVSLPPAPPGGRDRECLFAAVFANPHQSPLQIVDHREVTMPLAAADLVDANPMQRLAPPSRQPIGDRALDDGRHAFPVQAEMMGGFAPTQMPRQGRHRCGQCAAHPRPRLGPGQRFRAHSATLALDPPRPVAQHKPRLPQRQVAPRTLLHRAAVHPPATPPAAAAAQPPGT